MRAGPMKSRLVILQPVTEANAYGEERQTWVELRTVHAERKDYRGQRSEEVGEHFPDYSVRFLIRDAHPIEENWRVRCLGDYLYTVVAILKNIDRGYRELVCQRVNE